MRKSPSGVIPPIQAHVSLIKDDANKAAPVSAQSKGSVVDKEGENLDYLDALAPNPVKEVKAPATPDRANKSLMVDQNEVIGAAHTAKRRSKSRRTRSRKFVVAPDGALEGIIVDNQADQKDEVKIFPDAPHSTIELHNTTDNRTSKDHSGMPVSYVDTSDDGNGKDTTELSTAAKKTTAAQVPLITTTSPSTRFGNPYVYDKKRMSTESHSSPIKHENDAAKTRENPERFTAGFQ